MQHNHNKPSQPDPSQRKEENVQNGKQQQPIAAAVASVILVLLLYFMTTKNTKTRAAVENLLPLFRTVMFR